MTRIARNLGPIVPVCLAAVMLCIGSAAGQVMALQPVSPNTVNHVTLQMNPDVSTPDNRDAYLYLFPYDQETGKSEEFALQNDVSVDIAVLDQYQEFNIGLISGSIFAEWTISLLDQDRNVINEDGKKYEWSPTMIRLNNSGSSLWSTPREVEVVDFSNFGHKQLPNFDGTHVAFVRVTQTKEWSKLNGPAKFRLVFLGQGEKVEVKPRSWVAGKWSGTYTATGTDTYRQEYVLTFDVLLDFGTGIVRLNRPGQKEMEGRINWTPDQGGGIQTLGITYATFTSCVLEGGILTCTGTYRYNGEVQRLVVRRQ